MSRENKVCFASVDVEHDVGTGDSKTFNGVEEMDRLLEVFEKFNIPATLFITGGVIAKYPNEVQKWKQRGYEIASHSYAHRFFNELSDPEKENDIKKFVEVYRSIIGERPLGFRAPSHVIDEYTFKILKKYGFGYDSSIVPHYPPLKRYRGYRGKAPLMPYKKGGLVEVPVAGQVLGIPLAGAWIRGLPTGLYKAMFILNKPDFITLSMHSWDGVIDNNFYKKLDKILTLVKSKGYIFKTGEQIYGSF